ncbi:AAA family ATPase [Aetokthonos hydrillicola Thurmond2011]|jgi:hypothetical protein|uniref:AAA family ATPase n=1 Tax=Aetokthonos hydrillicola Thurmond2011 TaxID=2712845 RepID=A0AAP5M6B7_9CYAN|nr:AAA family ATPase [Aetokthonos hydrillicola]MBO3458252.1 ATP-binding protein [Aetokthonos hydrillicola CCALA 1050]MBW4586713.1 ATP-binding protein [Aetokthonos hydrillicola CCALA 1050]MDR9893960.1 AAA family ATPase [Aetokthonos hydrillicola Thurmond2011]
MATIDELIKQSVNPFECSIARNFWEESEPSPTVKSIHQKALTDITSTLSQISKDSQSRTILLYGEVGSGKTHFLGRLKETLNDQAFFVYIEPFPTSDHIWRHILRYTVDSLVKAPAGQKDSQLILWLKSCLSTIEKGLQSEHQSIIRKIQKLFGKIKTEESRERRAFIDILKQSIGIQGIYNANEFFGILYDLTNPNLYSLACEWLRGDSLDEESLNKLQVKHLIDNENSAQGILRNFSKICAKTQPIVLCFDSLDAIARLPDGSIDIHALFSVNMAIHNGQWKGFLIIISIPKETWNKNSERLQGADIDRISLQIPLERIRIDQAEELWRFRLRPMYCQASPKPDSPIYPLTQQMLKKSFPGHEVLPRVVLNLGKQEFQIYKDSLSGEGGGSGGSGGGQKEKVLAEFQLLWIKEFQKVKQKVTHLRHYSSPELIQMLQEALSTLKVEEIKPNLLSSPKYTSYSLSYQQPSRTARVGVVWAEESHMNSFYSVMEACQKSVRENKCQTLYLIRSEGVGKPNNKGYRLYTEIFTGSPYCHIIPDLTSVHYLATYHKLVNDARGGELEIGSETLNLKELEVLVRKSNFLKDCLLLQEIKIIEDGIKIIGKDILKLAEVEKFLLNLIQTQSLLAKDILIKNATNQFPDVNKPQVQQLIQQLYQSKRIKIVDEQLICWVPKTI